MSVHLHSVTREVGDKGSLPTFQSGGPPSTDSCLKRGLAVAWLQSLPITDVRAVRVTPIPTGFYASRLRFPVRPFGLA